MINSIDHLNIVVTDLDQSCNFFERLGFERIAEGNLEGSWIDKIVQLEDVKAYYVCFSLPGGTTKLELIHYSSPTAVKPSCSNEANLIGFRHIAFKVENIEECVERLKADGVTFFSEIQTYAPTNKKLVYFYGPDNIILELAQYG